MNAREKLRKAWPIIKWLDDARWNAAAWSSIIPPCGIPGPVFRSLDAGGQLLAHWLCYIMDQQRPSEQVWNRGGPVIAEVVQEYLVEAKQTEDVLDILSAFTQSRGQGRVDEFTSRGEKFQGKTIRFTRIFGAHLLSIARTLALLLGYGNDLVCYLSANKHFWLARIREVGSGDDDSPTLRLAFLLYVLSYDQIHNGTLSFHLQRDGFLEDLRSRKNELASLFSDEARLEARYRTWVKSQRFHKRLWASFRDYVKPGTYYGYYEKVFVDRFRYVGCNEGVDFLEGHGDEVLSMLELPGDTWVLQFSGMLFGKEISRPSDLRRAYTSLRRQGLLPNSYYPEQFDVSYDFSPRMCDRGNYRICPFRKDSQLSAYCHDAKPRMDALCPATMILCGYTTKCRPDGCPVARGAGEDLCDGCAYEIALSAECDPVLAELWDNEKDAAYDRL